MTQFFELFIDISLFFYHYKSIFCNVYCAIQSLCTYSFAKCHAERNDTREMSASF